MASLAPSYGDSDHSVMAPAYRVRADARALPLADSSIDLCLTSPPYWKKRDYGGKGQIGQEKTPEEYVESVMGVLSEIRRVLKPTGSLFLNIGDTYDRLSLVGIPFMIERAAAANGWRVRNRIIWAKPNGLPSPHKDRLTNRHEYILHLTGGKRIKYYYDTVGLAEYLGKRTPGGDVWEIAPGRHLGKHPAAFPAELAARVIALACPARVCRRCGYQRRRVVDRSTELDMSRQQARRALELVKQHQLTARHIAAIRATGISDAGKGARLQYGAAQNARKVRRLAEEAKRVLRGYFREFTFARPVTKGHTRCRCNKGWEPGLVLDVFAGTGTTAAAATLLGRRSISIDVNDWTSSRAQSRKGRSGPKR